MSHRKILCVLGLIVLLSSVWSTAEAADSRDYAYESYYYDYSEGQSGEQAETDVHVSPEYYDYNGDYDAYQQSYEDYREVKRQAQASHQELRRLNF